LEVVTVSTSESTTKPEPVSDEARTLQGPPRISSLVMIGGPIVAAAGVAGAVVLAALTSWWVLFALFALPPLMMVVWGPVMMTAMRGPIGSGYWAPRWCAPWLRSDAGRTTLAD
jgi:hypothetical protein